MYEIKPFDEYLESLRKKKVHLGEVRQAFKKVAEEQEDPFKHDTLKMISQYADAMQDLYSKIEFLSIYSFAFLELFDGLRNALLKIQNNPEFQKEIDRIFSEYTKRLEPYRDFFRKQRKDCRLDIHVLIGPYTAFFHNRIMVFFDRLF